jgi:hypothetical protein
MRIIEIWQSWFVTGAKLILCLAIGFPCLVMAQEQTAQSPAPSPACGTEYYTGTVGPLPVRAWLYRDGDKIDGFYAYEKWRRYNPETNRQEYRLIKLAGTVDAAGAVTLAETDAKARVTGHWRGIWEKEKLSGEWRNAMGENPLALSLQASAVFEDGEKPRFRLKLRPKLIEIESYKKRCGYEIVGVSFDGQPEIDLPRLVDSAVLGFTPDKDKDEFLDNISLSFSRWDGTPTLYGISYYNWGLEGYKHIIIPSGGTEKLLEFEGGLVMREGIGDIRVEESISFEYRGSHLRVKHVNTTSMGLCFVFCTLGEEDLCQGQRLENMEDLEEREKRCLARCGERGPSWVENTTTEMEEEYEIRQMGQGYVAKPLPRKTDGSHKEVLESHRSEVHLGEKWGEKGWKIATDYLKQETELLAYERVHRPAGGTTEAVKSNCRLWGKEQLLSWRNRGDMAHKHPKSAGQEKSQISLTQVVSCMSFLYSGDERSIAVHWTGADGNSVFSNLIGYYDGERQTCHSRFAEPGEKARQPLDKKRYRTLFSAGRKK